MNLIRVLILGLTFFSNVSFAGYKWIENPAWESGIKLSGVYLREHEHEIVVLGENGKYYYYDWIDGSKYAESVLSILLAAYMANKTVNLYYNSEVTSGSSQHFKLVLVNNQ